MKPTGWHIVITTHDVDIDVAACADFFVARLRDTPIAASSWRIHTAGRGEAHSGFGPPTRHQLAVPELVNGLMIFGSAGFLSLLSVARTRRVDKNWARLTPRTTGYKIQLNLKHLDDDAVDAAHARALALVPALRVLGASEGVIEWRARDRNHEQAVDFARP